MSATPLLSGLGVITIFVHDLDASRRFYAEVFGLKEIFSDDVSTVFDFGNIWINLLQDAESTSLIAPARVGKPDGGARSMLTIWIDDTDAIVAALAARGVSLLNGPQNQPWGVRTACFSDPDGTVWEAAQQLPQQDAS